MVKKILFTSHTANFQKFNRPFMRMLRGTLDGPYAKHNVGDWEVYYASADEEKILDCNESFKVDFARSPFRIDRHVKAYRQLGKILRENHYDIIHTHTPVGSIITRLAARNVRRNGTRIIYTNHGAHFLKGGPLMGWLLWFPIERFCSRFTDEIITINREDYDRFSKHMHCRIHYLDGGVGVDMEKFAAKEMSTDEKIAKRATLGVDASHYVIIYIAELIPRKNHKMAIEAMRHLVNIDPSAHLLLVGADSMQGSLQKLVKGYSLDGSIHFLGYRNDVSELCQVADLAIATSRQEGFGIGIMEALGANLPVVATSIRGHTEFSDYIDMVNVDDCIDLMTKIVANKSERRRTKKTLSSKYSLKNAIEFHKRIYER